MVPDVNADLKTGSVVGGAKRSQHFEKVIHRIGLTGNHAARLFRAREFGQQFGHVISYFPIENIGATENITHEDVEIKVRGNPKTSAAFQQRAKQSLIIENEVA